MSKAERGSTRGRDWGVLAVSVVLGLGFASAFLSPLWNKTSSTVPEMPGVVLGESLSKPLSVTVQVTRPTGTKEFQVQPVGGTLAEALALAAGAEGSRLHYSTRGDSIFVEDWLGLSNHSLGQWNFELRGRQVVDLHSMILFQGDKLSARWTPFTL